MDGWKALSLFRDCLVQSKNTNPQGEQRLGRLSSRGGLKVERLLHKLHDSTSVSLNPAWRQKDFRSNSNTTGGALINNE